jgi:hypothetical protein
MLVAPGGAARVTVSVTPGGSAVRSRPVMRRGRPFKIVTVYVVVALVTVVGCDPATAVLTRNSDGLAETVMVWDARPATDR